jgi:hypothetical protein
VACSGAAGGYDAQGSWPTVPATKTWLLQVAACCGHAGRPGKVEAPDEHAATEKAAAEVKCRLTG